MNKIIKKIKKRLQLFGLSVEVYQPYQGISAASNSKGCHHSLRGIDTWGGGPAITCKVSEMSTSIAQNKVIKGHTHLVALSPSN